MKTHHTHQQTSSSLESISFLKPPICHKPPTSNLYNPENGTPFAVGLIQPMATDSLIKTHHTHHTHHAHHTHKHLLPQNRGRAPSSDHSFATNHPHASSTTQKRRPMCGGSHPTHGPSTMSIGDTPSLAHRNRPKGN